MTELQKQDGINESERYLAELCNKTFLNLWSYPNVYTDEGKKSVNGDGKELCDLLVVFDNHVIIFSDKDIGFKDTGNINVDWGRWVKKAVIKSASQLYGAESSIKERPGRLFLDKKCTIPFPHEIPTIDKIKIHRIAVAKNASQRFSKLVDGSGSLIVDPSISGDEHFEHPFTVGHPIANKDFVHVFDDVALDIILSELDTISDFVDYIEKKEKFINSGLLGSAAGEEEILAHYLMSSQPGREPGFYIEDNQKAYILEGHYNSLISLPQYKRGKEEDKVSYFWDGFIEHFGKHALAGTLIYDRETLLSDAILGLKLMASERRVARRVLSKSIIEKVTSSDPGARAVRVMVSPTSSNNGYVWLLVPIPPQAEDYEAYRKYRQELLRIYCTSTKLLYPSLDFVVGIATEPRNGSGGEDMVYLDTTSWTEEDYENAKNDREQFNIFQPDRLQEFSAREYQYPVMPGDFPMEKKQSANSRQPKKSARKQQRKARKLNRKNK